jgi:hypothetical protein
MPNMASVLKEEKTGAPVLPPLGFGPDWVVAEMPPGYRNRVAEIQRLTADLQEMSRFGHLLCEVGAPLAESVRDLFMSLRFEAELIPGPVCTGVVVRLDGSSRLLLHVSGDEQVVQKKSPEIGHVFQMLHELADEHDHVVFVTNSEPSKPPAGRGEALAPDALAFISRMGASHVAAPTLFTLWKLSLQEPDRARGQVQRLHDHDGGTFQLPPSVLV